MILMGLHILEPFKVKQPLSRRPLEYWVKIAKASSFRHFPDVRKTFPSADQGHKPIIWFDIHGDHFRLATVIDYKAQVIAIRDIMTHEEYTRRGDRV